MQILVLNAGSSSLKCSVFDTAPERQLFKIELERLASVADGVRQLPALLAARGIQGIEAVAHRVVHGGSRFRDACVLDAEAIQAIEACVDLAPLHNPPALEGIRMATTHWPGLPQVGVFDTAFHQGMPAHASTYAVPREWRDTGLRRYGFHGTSHKYVMQRSAAALQASPQDLRIISCHLGNGASVCAIERGVSVDCSMGASTLEGLVMGSRSGDVDPGLFGHLHRKLGLSIEDIEDALYHRSGLLALSECGSDLRDIERQAAAGSQAARLAIQVYAYRVHKTIGAFAAVMGGVDVIAFTGGIGEHSAAMRKRICERLEFLGLALDDEANEDAQPSGSAALPLHLPHSRVKLLVTEAREQWMIACEADRVLRAAQHAIGKDRTIPVAVSNHHVHLTGETVEKLFGVGHRLKMLRLLSQPGQWVAEETVDVVGPHGRLHALRVLGPCRDANQIEISQTDAFQIGVDAPLRLSGQLANTPGVLLCGPAGSLRSKGVIVAQRHLHVHPGDAAELGLHAGEPSVDVEIHGSGRSLVFKDVAVRISPDFVTEMHLDTDEANAAHVEHGGRGELVPVSNAHARIHRRRPDTDGLQTHT